MSNNTPLEASDMSTAERMIIAEKMSTCPFIAAAVATQQLQIFQEKKEPVASIEEIVKLGDSGGGDLGRRVLKLFARGNHSRLLLSADESQLTADGFFSLVFGGSQGAHPGHSGILLQDPTAVGAGKFDPAAFQRLLDHSDRPGFLSIDGIGDFIAENIKNDKQAQVLPGWEWIKDTIHLLKEFKDVIINNTADEKTEAVEAITKILGEDHLVGSAGEWALLFAFLQNSPRTEDGDISIEDVTSMFVHKQFPDGWETWKKSALSWVKYTVRLTKDAAFAYYGGWK